MDLYQNRVRPFLVSKVAQLDRQLLPGKKSKPGTQNSRQNKLLADDQSQETGLDHLIEAKRAIKVFTLETIGFLLECIDNKKEEENILRSFYCHYESYHNRSKLVSGQSDASVAQAAQKANPVS